MNEVDVERVLNAGERPELPSSWAWTSAGTLLLFAQNGIAKRRSETGRPFNVLRLADVASGAVSDAAPRLINLSDSEIEAYRLGDDDVLCVRVNGSKRIAGSLVPFSSELEWAFCDHFIRLRPNPDATNRKYFAACFAVGITRRSVELKMVSSAGQNTVSQGTMRAAPVPLPPIAEQHRIIDEIEKQFTRLDAAVDALKAAQAKLKRYRASVLKAACEGKLVPTEAELARAEGRDYEPASVLLARIKAEGEAAPVRKRAGRLWGSGFIGGLSAVEESTLTAGWSWCRVRDLGPDPESVVQVGPMSMRSKEFASSGTPVLNVGTVQWDWIDDSKLNFLPSALAGRFERYVVRQGDVLFTRSGTVGRSAVVTPRHDGSLITFHLLRVRPASSVCHPKFLRAVFEGAPQIRRQSQEGSVGTTRAGFNTNLLADLHVQLPPMEEQQRIVDEIERRLSDLDATEQAVIANLKRADRLRQAILKRAFEGRLVPQDPNDEPASVLLARIKAQREAAGTSKPTRRKARA